MHGIAVYESIGFVFCLPCIYPFVHACVQGFRYMSLNSIRNQWCHTSYHAVYNLAVTVSGSLVCLSNDVGLLSGDCIYWDKHPLHQEVILVLERESELYLRLTNDSTIVPTCDFWRRRIHSDAAALCCNRLCPKNISLFALLDCQLSGGAR